MAQSNRRPHVFLSLVLFFLIGMVGRGWAEVTPHLLSRVEELSLGVRSYKADYVLILKVGEDEVRMKGKLLYKWPKQIRNEMFVDTPLGLRQVIYWKEGILWQYLPSSKVAFRQEEGVLRQKFPTLFASQELLDLRDPFDLVEKESVRFVEEAVGENQEATYLFEAVPKKALQVQGTLAPRLCRFRVSAADGLVRSFMMYDGSGQEIYAQTFEAIQINPEISDAEFEFRLPEDAEVVEVTGESEKRLKELAPPEAPSS